MTYLTFYKMIRTVFHSYYIWTKFHISSNNFHEPIFFLVWSPSLYRFNVIFIEILSNRVYLSESISLCTNEDSKSCKDNSNEMLPSSCYSNLSLIAHFLLFWYINNIEKRYIGFSLLTTLTNWRGKYNLQH